MIDSNTSNTQETSTIQIDDSQPHDNNNSDDSQNEQQEKVQNTSQEPDIDETAVYEYLELVENEYSIERGKKESFENRAGIIMALDSALFVFIIDKIPLSEVLSIMHSTLTYVMFLKITLGIISYVSLVLALLFSLFTITTRKLENYPISTIDLSHLAEKRINAITRIIFTYRDIIINHREYNEKRAFRFKLSLLMSIISIGCVILYISIQ